MNTGSVAKLLNVSPHTIHRWTQLYRAFLKAGAVPSEGVARVFCERDIRVMMLISQLRSEGAHHAEIEECLKIMVANDGESLPEVPGARGDTPTNLIFSNGYTEGQEQGLVPLEHVTRQLQESVQCLQLDEARIRELLADLANIQRILEEKAKDLSAKDELIAEQRRTLQMTQVALMTRTERQDRATESARRRRWVIGFVLLLLGEAAAAAYFTLFH